MPRILLIEDDQDVRVMTEHVLRDAGYEVDSSITVGRGGELFEDYDYDLVVTDLRLGDGAGLKLADNAQEKGIPALIVTGFAFAVHSGKAGIDLTRHHVLLKPARPHELLAAVARALNGARP
jgi:two-component system response regulator PilR (NtrC family)